MPSTQRPSVEALDSLDAEPAENDEFYLMGRVPKDVYARLQHPG